MRKKTPLRILRYAGKTFIYCVLVIGAVSMIFPFIWAVLTSLKADASLYTWPPVLLPAHPQFANFVRAWNSAPFTRFFINSVVVAGLTTALMLVLSSAAGFAFAKYSFRGRNILFIGCLGTMMVPFQVRMIPLFQMMTSFRMLDTYQAMILPEVISAFGIFIVRQFMSTIPDELLEAGRMDGCSETGLLFRIMIPLSKPVLAVLATLTFQWQWNNFLWPLIVVRNEKMFTLQVGMALFRGQYHTEWNLLMAVVVIGLLPTLVFALTCQRYLVKGVMMSGIKG